MAEGARAFTAELTDTGGNTGVSGANNPIKDITAPLITLDAAADVAMVVSRDALDDCICGVFSRLLDPRLPHVQDGQQLLRALNLLMLKVLDHGDRNLCFSVLLRLLSYSAEEIEELPANRAFLKHPRCADLVLKCLWKLTKGVAASMEKGDANADALIRDIHLFFNRSSAEETSSPVVKTTAAFAATDMSLRTVKTLLNEIVKHLGVKVVDHLSLVPLESEPVICKYVDHMLVANGFSPLCQRRIRAVTSHGKSASPSARLVSRDDGDESEPRLSAAEASSVQLPSLKLSQEGAEDEAPEPQPPVTETAAAEKDEGEEEEEAKAETMTKSDPSLVPTEEPCSAEAPVDVPREETETAVTDAASDDAASPEDLEASFELKMQLADIFRAIGSKETTETGLAQLWAMKKKHPNLDYSAHLQSTSTTFQAYIERGLERLSEEEEEEEENDACEIKPAPLVLQAQARIANHVLDLEAENEESVVSPSSSATLEVPSAPAATSISLLQSRLEEMKKNESTSSSGEMKMAVEVEEDKKEEDSIPPVLEACSENPSVSVVPVSAVPAPSASSNTTVASLRERLNRIKQGLQ